MILISNNDETFHTSSKNPSDENNNIQAIYEILCTIPEWDRDVLELHVSSGLTLKSIADIMNIRHTIAKERLELVVIVLVHRLKERGIYKEKENFLQDDELLKALEIIMQKRIDELPDEEELNAIKVNSDLNTIIQLANQEKKHFYIYGKSISKAATFFMLFVILLTTTAFAIYRIRLNVVNHEKSADIFAVLSEYETQLEIVETIYLPDYIPKGYVLSEQIGKPYEDYFIRTLYTDQVYNLEFQQSITSFVFRIDNENVVTERISINGYDGIYQEDTQEKLIVWVEKDYFYLLRSLNPNMKKKELLKIAESLKESTNDKK